MRNFMITDSLNITARVDTETYDLLILASAIDGMPSVNSFVLSAAIEKAKQVINGNQVLKLGRADALRLIEELDRPAISNAKLKAVSSQYHNKAQ